MSDPAAASDPRRPPMNAWRRRFIARVLVATLGVQLPSMLTVAWWLRDSLGRVPALAAGVALHLALSLIAVRRLVFFRDAVRTPWWLAWLVETPYSSFVAGSFFAFGPSVIVLAWAFARGVPAMHLVAQIHLVCWALGALGGTVGRLVPVVRRRDVRVEGLPRAFDGFRIAQLSDVHCGPYLPRAVYRYWTSRASSLGADLVVLTGDLITSGEGYLDDVRDMAAGLRAPEGVAACMGNHDYFGTETGVIDALGAAGVRLLRNEGFALSRDGAPLWIAGIDDRWTRRDDLTAALAGRPDEACVVLLAHDPASFPEAAAAGVALTLSGHTHGGQFGVPGPIEGLNLARALTRYSAGMFREGRSALYVNRGIGTTGAPVRVGMWPEITLLTLRAA